MVRFVPLLVGDIAVLYEPPLIKTVSPACNVELALLIVFHVISLLAVELPPV